MISNWDDLPEMKAKAKAKAMMKPPEEIPLPQVDFDSDEENIMMRKKIQQLEEENANLHRQHSRNKDTLPDKTALELLRSWGPHTNQYRKAWQQLVQHHRPFLRIVFFSEEVQKRYSTNSSIRLSNRNWNGADLETEEGVQFAIKMLRQHRPVHLWISCECGPYSPLQRLNQRNPQQVQQLHDKQQRGRRQYQGALRVADEAFRLKTEVHWELSQRCEAWSLPEIRQPTQTGKGELRWVHSGTADPRSEQAHV